GTNGNHHRLRRQHRLQRWTVRRQSRHLQPLQRIHRPAPPRDHRHHLRRHRHRRRETLPILGPQRIKPPHPITHPPLPHQETRVARRHVPRQSQSHRRRRPPSHLPPPLRRPHRLPQVAGLLMHRHRRSLSWLVASCVVAASVVAVGGAA